MKIERLRKSHKKEIIIGVLAVLGIVATITMTTSKAKYRTTQILPLVEGEITYTPYDFKIMAMYKSDDGVNYIEITDRMPSSGYAINESKSYCTIDNVNHDNEAKLYTNTNGEHVFANLKKIDKCYIWFDKEKLGADTILANLGTNIETVIPTFSSIATTNEGVYKIIDEMYGGTTYYWRGSVTNNYVKFAGYCWRIIRINGDKTIRMIYDGTTCHANGTSTTDSLAVTSKEYNSNNYASYFVGWTYGSGQRTLSGTSSNAKRQIESWYNSHIGNNATYNSYVVNGKFCNDRDTELGGTTGWSTTGSEFHYAGYRRLRTNKTPTLFNCPSGDVYTLKVGAITADEVAFAGGIYYFQGSNNNTNYYLYNGQDYWTMTPSYWNGTSAYVFYVGSNGNLSDHRVDWTEPGLRPVINLRSDVTFKSGSDGTQNSPYIVQ